MRKLLKKYLVPILIWFLLFTPQEIFADEAKELYSFGMKYLKQGDVEFALLKFDRIIETYPNSKYADEALYRVSEYHFKQNNLFDAEKYLKKHQKSYPNSLFKDDVKVFLHSISVIRLLDRAELNYQNGDWQGAFEDYEEIIDLRPFEAKAEEKINQFKNSMFNAIIAKADKAFNGENFEEALDLYGKANALDVQRLDEKIKACNENIDFIKQQQAKGLVKHEGEWMAPEEKIGLSSEKARKNFNKISEINTAAPIKNYRPNCDIIAEACHNAGILGGKEDRDNRVSYDPDGMWNTPLVAMVVGQVRDQSRLEFSISTTEFDQCCYKNFISGYKNGY